MAYVVGKFETKALILAMKPSGLLASFATMNSVFDAISILIDTQHFSYAIISGN